MLACVITASMEVKTRTVLTELRLILCLWDRTSQFHVN